MKTISQEILSEITAVNNSQLVIGESGAAYVLTWNPKPFRDLGCETMIRATMEQFHAYQRDAKTPLPVYDGIRVSACLMSIPE